VRLAPLRRSVQRERNPTHGMAIKMMRRMLKATAVLQRLTLRMVCGVSKIKIGILARAGEVRIE